MMGTKNYFSSTTISVAGGQANGVNYLLDGGDNNDSFTNVNLPIPFPMRCRSSAYRPAACRRRGSACIPARVVNAVTKSGTNAWHGDAVRIPSQRQFERPKLLRARTRHAEAQPVRRHIRRQNRPRQALLLRRIPGDAQSQRSPTDVSFVPRSVLHGDFSTIDSGACVSGGKARR